MLVNVHPDALPAWADMEIPRTGSTSIDKTLRKLFPSCYAPVGKHWPVDVYSAIDSRAYDAFRFTCVRNPFSRAVSCWQFFTPSGSTFKSWLTEKRKIGFRDQQIEARPQSYWYWLENHWDLVLRQETLETDFKRLVKHIGGISPEDPRSAIMNLNRTGRARNRFGHVVPRRQDWKSYYDEECVELVTEIYADDFEALDYSYEISKA